MKKLYLALGAAALLALPVAQAAYDGKVTISDGAFGTAGFSGGPFTATVTSGGSSLIGLPSFQTFCVEKNEYLRINPPGSYDFNIDSKAYNGGVAGGSPDPISKATAWLYSQFRVGALVSTGWAANAAGGDALQNAIWYLEQEINPLVNSAEFGTFKYLLDAALAATGVAAGDYATARATHAAVREYGVVVLNLMNGPGINTVDAVNQSVLGMVPEPTTVIAGALLLLPFGLNAVRVMRRNKQA